MALYWDFLAAFLVCIDLCLGHPQQSSLKFKKPTKPVVAVSDVGGKSKYQGSVSKKCLLTQTIHWQTLLFIILITVIFITFVLFLEFHQRIILFHIATLPQWTSIRALQSAGHTFTRRQLANTAAFTRYEFQYHVGGRKSCHPTDAESTTLCPSPSMAILWGRNRRLGLSASSSYCR